MTRQADTAPPGVFVSYAPADERWAAWIAWQLELAGFRTVLRAWDRPVGTPLDEFVERALVGAAATVAVFSRAYLTSTATAAERRRVFRADAARLVPVRIDDHPLEGLAGAPVDLAAMRDPRAAAAALTERLGRATAVGTAPALPGGAPPSHPTGAPGRRAPLVPPPYPPAARPLREGVALLHVAGPRFGRGIADPDEPITARELQDRLHADVTRLVDDGAPPPDLVVVSGDITESGRPRQLAEAHEFLTGLRVVLGLGPDRLVVVPGGGDVSRAACEAYFHDCEARERTPVEPFFPKLSLWAELFADLYDGLEGPVFDAAQPWTLFAVPELRVAIAGLNSTMAISHRARDDHGRIGEAQASWFAQRLRSFEEAGWLRVGVVRHDPLPGTGGAHDPATLRDAATLDGLLGARLHLLLHGPGPGGTSTELLGGRLPVLPAAGPGRAEIVHVTAEGLRRVPTRGASGSAIERSWNAAAQTFVREEPASAPEPPAIGAGNDPHALLLARIADVCAAADPQTLVRRVDTDPPQLLVTRIVDGLTVQRRVGAHVGVPTAEAVDRFAAHDPGPGDELVHSGPAPGDAVRAHAARLGVRLRSFAAFQGMLDLGGYVEGQNARLRSDPAYPPPLYVPQRYRNLRGDDQSVRADLAGELMRLVTGDEGRFVLVLGDFGRGKSFVLREVARQLGEAPSGPVPILVDLALLDRATTVDGLVAAHLARHGEDRIDLRAFRYMLDEGRIVLLLDGFDELVTRVSYDRAVDHLTTLIDAAQGRAKIVVAARMQHFRTHEQVFTVLGTQVGSLEHRRALAVEDFTAAQIREWFVRRHHGDTAAADARFQLLRGVEDLLELAQNPRMLGFVADLDVERLRAVVAHRHTLSPAPLYAEIVSSWLAHEARRASGGAGAAPGLDAATLHQAVTALAVTLWERDETLVRVDRLVEVADALAGGAAGPLSRQQRVHAIGSGSLLTRTEDGQFGFVHPSIVDWLVAEAVATDVGAGVAVPPALAVRCLRQRAVDFLCDIADTRLLRDWAAGAFSAGGALAENARLVLARLDVPASADLRGAALRGADLSYRDLADVDLSGADLTDANLAHANLSGAELRDARLVAARLEGTRLVGANLAGADLSRARLTRADLTGVTVAGSQWTRAALVDVTGVPDAPELRSAAVAPGTPVGTELAPSTIGVRHGFHTGMGWLPQPLDYGPDGGTLVIGGDDGGVLVCGTVTGRPLRTLTGHRRRVFAVTHGRAVLATGSADATARLWDPVTGRLQHILAGHHRWAWPVVLAPDERAVATGDAAGTLRLWDTGTGALRHEITAAGGFAVAAAFLDELVAVGHHDGHVRLYDAATGASAGDLTAADGPVHRLAAVGGRLVTAGAGGRLAAWDTRAGEVAVAFEGHTGDVYALAAHPDGLLASGDALGEVRLWDATAGELRYTLAGHTCSIFAMAFDPSGGTLATGDSAGVVCLWHTATGRLLHRLDGHTGSVYPFAFRPDGGQLAVPDDQLTTRIWDTATGACHHMLRGHGRRVSEVRFSASGSLLATSGNDGIVRLWNPATGQQARTVEIAPNRLWTAVFSPTGPLLVTADGDGRLALLDLDTNTYERYLEIETAPLWTVAMSPSGRHLATSDDDDVVRVWHARTGRPVHTLREHRGRVRSIAYSADGALLATGCDDSRIRIWDAATGRLLRTLEGHTDRVYALAFGRDVLASASWDTTARLWDAASGDCRHVLTRHTGRLWSVAFHPDGTLLATAGDDLVVRLWDARQGDHLQTLAGHTRRVASLAFHPQGHLLASGASDGTARLWTVTEGQAARHLVLLGLPQGWAALHADGRYKVEGDIGHGFWHVVNMSRFEVGELDGLLPEIRRMPPAAPF